MVYGGLDKAAQAYKEASEKNGNKPGRMMCSYFIHIADTPEQEAFGAECQMRYFKECALRAFPKKTDDLPPTMKYFYKIVDILENMQTADLSASSILLGSPQHIIDTLKGVEEAGIAEVILYFNIGTKPNEIVREQMHRFMDEIAPHFEGLHKQRHAATAQ
jgi:alkanesulfonate monooxygenase SsuD/methylene tetrahydromethanopterin reductase-like flavin-dependent oxidoreductase (luciferase family)